MTGPTRDLRWPLPELLVNAAPGRGDNCSMPNLAHDTRHDRALAGRSERQLRRPGMIACGDSSCCGLEVSAAEVVVSAAEVPSAEVASAAEITAAEVVAAVSAEVPAAEVVPAVVIARVAVAVLVDEDRR